MKEPEPEPEETKVEEVKDGLQFDKMNPNFKIVSTSVKRFTDQLDAAQVKYSVKKYGFKRFARVQPSFDDGVKSFKKA